jgi:hypothetical protein
MTPLFKKLNLKDQREIGVLNAPESFEPELQLLDGVRVQRDPEEVASIDFALAFATRQAELDELVARLTAKATSDAVLWFAYPKKSSRRYKADFDRDTGWDALGAAGFEPVRQIAIDEDWSAVRFRRAEHIKSMTRDPARALSERGRSRASRRED